MSSCNLFHGNSIFEKPQHRRWTWESPNGQTHSELDHVLTNRRWSLMDTTVLPSFDSGSDHRLLRAKIRLNDRIFKRDRHRGPPVRSPEYDEQELQKAMDMYPWRKIEDPTADNDELAKGLALCVKAAMTNHKQREERLNEKAKQLLRRRGEVRRDPAATHFEKVVINKACRIAMEESLREHRKSKLFSTAVQTKSLKRCRRELTLETMPTRAHRLLCCNNVSEGQRWNTQNGENGYRTHCNGVLHESVSFNNGCSKTPIPHIGKASKNSGL
ncbi:hypothetical protein Y032_0119g869 [Ancylostoma ceylanicum]|uniref:Endonuclease/exonuclease/phosphatase domain-containing protein n=1 Tax=Ancylostoma ceylanicum TaxID=53326 RepID=A0A016TBF6_9BILA|nr:hypothetical protein Y032_0119g869 [Ancylostoma ceylanicum]